ncbi:transposase [Cohnella sp. CFH 77786]|uniref:transposase n=1 Tax=Cohnella sp. CFH 77786 TaxID=2662265 RepID=UPI001C610576|nr:transposase [Cohnella sp. CFH 77786]MBW5445458.1 transposase [Cohnella sp. CFH 77786]
MSEKKQRMLPLSGEMIEVDGVYKNEWGRELELQRGNVFPADPVLGTTEWELVEFSFDNHHEGETDPRLVPQSDKIEALKGKITHPRRHYNRQDR